MGKPRVLTDEMNIFVPQSVETQIELEYIADLKLQIITPQTSSPIIAMKQDQQLGAYNLTSEHYKFNSRTVMNLLSSTELDPQLYDKVKKDKEYTGKELYSFIIPDKINLLKGPKDNPKIYVKNGQMLGGILGEDALGVKKKNSLVQLVWDSYGVETTRKFLDNTTRLVTNFNLYNGMSVGIGDLYVSDEVYRQMKLLSDTKKLKVECEITEIENNPDMSEENMFEYTINSSLAVIRDDVGKLIIDNVPKTNNFVIMMKSGAKGKEINLAQMAGCVGQQDFHGGRILKNYNSRSLPCFFKNDDTAMARGFVENSFIKGLNLPEYIFHHLSSREGLIDQAVRTSESGYLQRRLIKAGEDYKKCYDGTVRSASGKINQYIYGDSGADTIKQYEYYFNMMKLGNEEIKKIHIFDDNEIKKMKNWSREDNDKLFTDIKMMRDKLRKTQIKATGNYIILANNYMIPVNLVRIIDDAKTNPDNDNKLCNDPKYIIDMIEDILANKNTILYCMRESERNNPESFKSRDDYIAKSVLKYAIYDIMSPKKCIIDYKFTKEQLKLIRDDIIKSFNKNIVEPGEMVGIIGAQSLGEPLTQLMLNSFHSSGVGGKGGTNTGVDRIREVFSLSRNPKEPYMIIYMDEEYQKNKDYVNKIASHIKYITIKDIRTSMDIYYDPSPNDKGGFYELDKIGKPFHSQSHNKMSCSNSNEGLPWLLRLQLDKDKMFNKDITLLDIKAQFCSSWEKRYADLKGSKRDKKQLLDKITQIAISSNNDNDETPIIHIRFDLTNYNSNTFEEFMNVIIDDFKLKGLTNIVDIRNGGKAVLEQYVSFDKDGNQIIPIADKDSDDVPEDKKKIGREYIINTKGINMEAIRNIKGIDLNRTYCNDIITTYEIFGIEAARTLIIREIIDVLTSNGSGTNYQHISMFGDLMTNIGTLTSIDRHGINKLDTDPFSRASFEKSVDQLLASAVFNEVDHMKSVSSRIMAGLCIKGGTGLCDVILDTELLQNSQYTTDIGQLYKKTFNNINEINKHKEINDDVFIPSLDF